VYYLFYWNKTSRYNDIHSVCLHHCTSSESGLVVDRRVFRELLSAGYGLLPGRLPCSGGCWVARYSWRSALGRVEARGGKICMGPMILWAAVLATVLVNGGVELNPGPVDSIVQVLRSGCKLCGRCYHNSCGNVKFQVAESGK
jgi:hypothetical protein